MRMLRFLLLLCLISAPLQAGQSEPTDHPDYGIVKGVIEDSIGWAIDKDLDRLLEVFANDDDLLIWWVGSNGGADGIDDLKRTAETVWMKSDFKATRFEFRNVRIRFSKDGTTAWFSCHLDDCGIWKGRSSASQMCAIPVSSRSEEISGPSSRATPPGRWTRSQTRPCSASSSPDSRTTRKNRSQEPIRDPVAA